MATGEGIEYIPDRDLFVKVSFQLKVGNLIDSKIMQLLPLDFAKSYVNQLISNNGTDQVENNIKESEPEMKDYLKMIILVNRHISEQESMSMYKKEINNVEKAQFLDFEEPTNLNKNESRNLDLLLDIPFK